MQNDQIAHSRIHTISFAPHTAAQAVDTRTISRERVRQAAARTSELLNGDEALQKRLQHVIMFSRRVRASEYHLTNACNIRCKGCWFFEYGHDRESRDVTDFAALERFVVKEAKERKVNCPMIIGGEPSLFPERLRLYAKHMRYSIVSTNGYKKLPVEGLERTAVALSLFGGGPLDDELRAIKPNGQTFVGLFERTLENYKDDPRAAFIYAVTEDGLEYIEETVRKIRDNGNVLNFNFYSKYGSASPTAQAHQNDLLHEALRVKRLYPNTVISHPYYIETMITGRTHWGAFSYSVCPSVSVDHPANQVRLQNGNPYLPIFNAWSADLKTLKLCCTSGHCDGCRDSQAVFSWLMMSMDKFLENQDTLKTWVEIAESYWSQFIWAPLHRHYVQANVSEPELVEA